MRNMASIPIRPSPQFRVPGESCSITSRDVSIALLEPCRYTLVGQNEPQVGPLKVFCMNRGKVLEEGPLLISPITTLRRVENARREARQVFSNVKITGRRGVFCSARSPGGRAGSRENCEKNPANCAAAVVSRARRRLSMRGVAYSAGRAVIFSMTVWTCSLRETQRQNHTDTQRHAHRLSLSRLQPGIVRVRVAKVFWAMAQLPHASLSVQCKRPQHCVESRLLSEPLN